MTLVAIEDPDADVGGDSRASEPLLTIAPSQLLKPSGKIDLKTVAARVEIDDNADSATQESEAPGDASGRAFMFGRYMGQITARISRAWSRPRTPVGGEEFACRIQINQDHTGLVKEVTLKQCNGDARWQLSLVHAIESASPLPAPPDPTVFAASLTLEMRLEQYDPGRNGDGFEPETQSARVVATVEARTARSGAR